ncbi:MAG: hypothetical protein JWP73_294, partial [Phenylobacterium sp.]|nr:hypothetical protein [Phenylobacterium sp.]
MAEADHVIAVVTVAAPMVVAARRALGLDRRRGQGTLRARPTLAAA